MHNLTKDESAERKTSRDQFITHTCHCLYFHRAAIHLLAKVCNMHVYCTSLAIEIESPGELKQLLARKNTTRLFCQGKQQIEFLSTQVKSPFCDADFTRDRVDHQITAMNRFAVRRPLIVASS